MIKSQRRRRKGMVIVRVGRKLQQTTTNITSPYRSSLHANHKSHVPQPTVQIDTPSSYRYLPNQPASCIHTAFRSTRALPPIPPSSRASHPDNARQQPTIFAQNCRRATNTPQQCNVDRYVTSLTGQRHPRPHARKQDTYMYLP